MGFKEIYPFRFYPGEEDAGKRLDKYLAEEFEDLSRTRLQMLIESGNVCSPQGILTKSSTKVDNLEWIEVIPPPPLESGVLPENLPIEILHEDRDLAVVFKPAGMPTHPTTTKLTGTLVNALLFHLRKLSGVGGVLRPGIVHRLDRVTSGLLVVAKNQQAHDHLSKQFHDRQVRKTYRALCVGKYPGRSGCIEGSIQRNPVQRQRMRINAAGRVSLTSYRCLFHHPPVSGVLLYPHSGRTHQIRVHLESLHLSIILDTLYGYKPEQWTLPLVHKTLRGYPGILLHAERLEFTHPGTGQWMRFRKPPPEVFQQVWEQVYE